MTPFVFALAGQMLAVDAGTLDRTASCDRLTVEQCAPLAELVEAGQAGVAVGVAGLGAEDVAARTRARRFLAHPALGEATQRAAAVKAALADVQAERRGEALLLLAELGHPEAAELLAAVVKDDAADGRTRIYAAAGLGELTGDVARAALESVLGAPIPRLQEAAVTSLGRKHLPAALPALVNVALGEMVPGFVRVAAARAMAASKDGSVVPALVLLLGVPQVPTQVAAIEALGALNAKVAVPALLPLLRGPETADAVVRALGALRDPRSTAALTDLLGAAETPGSRVSAILWTLGELDDPAAVPALGKRLADTDLSIARAAAEALGRIAHASALDYLVTTDARGDAALEKSLAWARAECTKAAATP